MRKQLFLAFTTLVMSTVAFGQSSLSFSPPTIQVGGTSTLNLTLAPGAVFVVVEVFPLGSSCLHPVPLSTTALRARGLQHQ